MRNSRSQRLCANEKPPVHNVRFCTRARIAEDATKLRCRVPCMFSRTMHRTGHISGETPHHTYTARTDDHFPFSRGEPVRFRTTAKLRISVQIRTNMGTWQHCHSGGKTCAGVYGSTSLGMLASIIMNCSVWNCRGL